MKPKYRCAHCRRLFVPNPRLKEQGYCRRNGCQRARKKLWQRRKMAQDADYRQTKRLSDQQWRKENPDYWGEYRARHPGYCRRNRLLQKRRDAKRRRRRDLAKKDALMALHPIKTGTYYLVPPGPNHLAKKDALGQEVVIISMG